MNHLKSGHTASCGCIQLDTPARYRHGEVHTKLYKVWGAIKERCHSPTASGYTKYGAKGVTMCEEWHDYVVFSAWAKDSGYAVGLTIERLNVYEGYNPENCTWVPMSGQGINKRKPVNNTSGYVGVNRGSSKGSRWCARATVNKKEIRIGMYDTPELADAARKQYFIDNNLQDHLRAYELQHANQ